MPAFDLNFQPFVRIGGLDQADLPGLYAASVPRRAARGRGEDRLVIYLTLAGGASLPQEQQDSLLAHVSQTYYHTPGSVTAALRAAAEDLNRSLLDRNVRNASSGAQAIGLLALLALRGEQLFLALSGPVHAYLATATGTQQLHDVDIAGRGLGMSKTTPIRYAQAGLNPNDTVLLAAQPSHTWNTGALAGIYGQGPESLRRRLLNRAGPDVNAVLVQARPGSGKINLLRVKPGAQPASMAVEPQPEAGEAPAAPVVAVSQPVTPAAPPPPTAPPAATSEPDLEEEALEDEPAEAAEQTIEDLHTPFQPLPAETQAVSEAPLPRAAPAAKLRSETGRHSRAERGPGGPNPIAAAFRKLGHGLRVFLGRILPGESLFTLPSSTMAFIALAVPIAVVTMASVVYVQRGVNLQYQALYSQAEESAREAGARENLSERRTALENTLSYLSQAESYRVTSDSQKMRQQVQSALDQIDGIKRPDFRPAIIGGLPDEVKVTRVRLIEGDLYVLDATSGNILRFIDTRSGYEMDRSFQCGRTYPGGYAVSQLIDFVPRPPGNGPEGVLLAMDAGGNLLYCKPGESPQSGALKLPARPKGGDLAGLTLDQGNLYLLDPASQAVWIYWDSDIAQEPQLFFSEEIPPMQDVISMTVDKSDLYLLHSDGHLTICTFSSLGVSPTRCADPVPYADTRPNREGQILIPESPFGQVYSTQPPDPSLFLLAPESLGIYRFSLRSVSFVSQFLPASGLPAEPATAFTINPLERTLFLAIGNDVYYASMP